MELAEHLVTDPIWFARLGVRPPRRADSAATLPETVVGWLRARIVQGTLEPGALLRETALAQELGVSGTPIREALAMLAAEGLVEIETHRLKRVAPLDLAATRDLLCVQSELWRLGYRWGMPRVGKGQVALLERAIARYGAALAADDHIAAIIAGLDFHTIFIMASANRELLRSTLDRRGLIARFIFLHGIATLSAKGLSRHRAIVAAFRAGDHSAVLACLDELAARLIALCGETAPANGFDKREPDGLRTA